MIFSDLFRCIGNGRTTKIWSDAWVPGNWRSDILNGLFIPEIIDRIQSIGLSCRQHDDKWVWLADARGLFTVTACYKHYMAAQWNEINLLPEIQRCINFCAHLRRKPHLCYKSATELRSCVTPSIAVVFHGYLGAATRLPTF
ncbi:uncharacterized protein G2W53_025922 [Senna tora]|uniref:Uncharacterized protein n=1 Tax=Senna tora TaxID=362788 RepID=A0A834TE44_9FABA|nr:uncharacterized protein G2W53_025922 [Senna tora]